MYQLWEQGFSSAQAAGTAATAAATTTVLPTQALFTIPANFFQWAGMVLRVHAAGQISTASSSPGTIQWGIYFGSTAVFLPAASATMAVSQTNVLWLLDMMLTIRAVGSGTSANLIGTGLWISTAIASPNLYYLPASAPAVGTGFDSTVAQTVDLRVTLSATGNSVTCHQYILESPY